MHADLMSHLNRKLQVDGGLSLSDFAVLVALTDREAEQIRVVELADELRWEKSRLSHQLGRMEKRDLIERYRCATDARGSFVALSAQGRSAIEEAAPQHVATVRDLVFDRLTEEQIDALLTISQTVQARLAETS